MGCKQLFVNLGGSGGSVSTGVLQMAGGVALDSTLRFVEDQNGTDSPLKLSTTEVNCTNTFSTTNISSLYSGTIYAGSNFANVQANLGVGFFGNGSNRLQVKGSGGNIASFRSSADVEQASISNVGVIDLINSGSYNVNGRFSIKGDASTGADGNIVLGNTGNTTFGILKFGGTTNAFPAIKRNGSAFQFKVADDSAFATIEPLEVLTRAPSGGTAKKIKFGERIAVTDGALTALGIDSQWLVEIDATNYYILGGTTQFS